MKDLFNNLLILSYLLIYSIKKINNKKTTSLNSEAKLLIFDSKHEKRIKEVEDGKKNSDEESIKYEEIGTE